MVKTLEYLILWDLSEVSRRRLQFTSERSLLYNTYQLDLHLQMNLNERHES
jgi:hypothetical protein